MLNQPLLEPIDDNGNYKLVQDFIYPWTEGKHYYRLIVPKNEETDGASVPRFCWTPFGFTPIGLTNAGAVAHDELYRYQGNLPSGQLQEHFDGSWICWQHKFTREDCDKMFLKIMLESGVHKTKAYMYFYAVRTFGWLYWHRLVKKS